MKFKQGWLFLFIFLMVSTNPLTAQKDNSNKKPNKVQKVKAANHGNSVATIVAQISEMDREEKNTLSRCPLHSKHMSLSDNYRADESDYTSGDHYPFAYQLNYRRYCQACTRVMEKESKIKPLSVVGEVPMQVTCEVHNSPLLINSNIDKVDYEHNPAADMPHAKQYLLKKYCKVCTKIYQIQVK